MVTAATVCKACSNGPAVLSAGSRLAGATFTKQSPRTHTHTQSAEREATLRGDAEAAQARSHATSDDEDDDDDNDERRATSDE